MLRQVGADLHDGPAQLVALAAMKVDRITDLEVEDQRVEAIRMKTLLDGALSELRAISKGHMLPEIQEMHIEAVIERAVSLHQLRMGTAVQYEIVGKNDILPAAVNVCVVRFIQEGLNNAFWQAGGQGQTIICRVSEREVAVSVSDGAGESLVLDRPWGGLGLGAMRDRVESLGGSVDIAHTPEGGTRVSVVLPIRGGGEE
jgi:signal transduction histidine kinase